MINKKLQKEIKSKKKKFFKIIKKANSDLEILREKCTHPNTKGCNYSYGPGMISPATICSDCGELVDSELLNLEFNFTSFGEEITLPKVDPKKIKKTVEGI